MPNAALKPVTKHPWQHPAATIGTDTSDRQGINEARMPLKKDGFYSGANPSSNLWYIDLPTTAHAITAQGI